MGLGFVRWMIWNVEWGSGGLVVRPVELLQDPADIRQD